MLKGDRRKAIEEVFEKLNNVNLLHRPYGISADLTCASDRIPHSVSQTIWDAICDVCAYPDWARAVSHWLTGPMKLLYPDGEILETTSGILMGTPTTWVTLSFLHLYWADYSVKAASRRERKNK